jgi:hypothetical protein
MTENNALNLDPKAQRKGRIVFLLMLVFFIVPIIVVVMMYKLNWKPQGDSLGQLVKPPRTITSPLEALDSDAKAASPLLWKEKWSIVYISEDCQEVCQGKLLDMRRLHVSLYKDMVRTQRIFITKQGDVSSIKKDFPELIVINQPVSAMNDLMKEFQIDKENPEASNRLYLVDPLGFLMMSYPSDTPLANVRKDITRLLKYSWAG